jgi:hypothetical protein
MFTPTPTISPEQQKVIDESAGVKLTPDQQAAIDSINKSINGIATAYADGKVFDKYSYEIQGVAYDKDRGVLTHEILDANGKPVQEGLIVKLSHETMPKGALVDLEGYVLVERAKADGTGKEVFLAGKTLSTVGGWGYEGDGIAEHKNNVPARSMFAEKRILENVDDKNMNIKTIKKIDDALHAFVIKQSDGTYSIILRDKDGEEIINVPPFDWGWGDDKVVSLENGKYVVRATTPYYIYGPKDKSFVVAIYTAKDGSRLDVVDNGNLLPIGNGAVNPAPGIFSDNFYNDPKHPERRIALGG